jgi:hypothetical protein
MKFFESHNILSDKQHESNVNATGRLFADDCLWYCTIKTTDDAVSLQNNLDTLQQWKKDWLMSFNPDKCEVI